MFLALTVIMFSEKLKKLIDFRGILPTKIVFACRLFLVEILIMPFVFTAEAKKRNKYLQINAIKNIDCFKYKIFKRDKNQIAEPKGAAYLKRDLFQQTCDSWLGAR